MNPTTNPQPTEMPTNPKVYYSISTHAYERLTPFVLKAGKELTKALDELVTDKAAQEKYLIGVPSQYKKFSRNHHPTNPYQLALWPVSLFIVQYGKLTYVGNEIERPAGLGLLCDEFITHYFAQMDKVNWENQDGTPIEKPLSHILDAFDKWREEDGKELLDDTGFPRNLGKYNDCLWAAWETKKIRWNFDSDCLLGVRALPPLCFENLSLRGIVPYFSLDDQIIAAKSIVQKAGGYSCFKDKSEMYTPPNDEEQRRYDIGLPLPYAGFSPSHHPTNMMHLAMWFDNFDKWHDVWREEIKYEGPYVKRAGELKRLPDEFISYYLTKMDSLGWKNPNGTPIVDALKHILDTFEEWRRVELGKPINERVCVFADDGFPVNPGKRYKAFLEAVNAGDAVYACEIEDARYEALAFRGLVPDKNHVRQLQHDEMRFSAYLFDRVFDDDESLVPAEFAALIED